MRIPPIVCRIVIFAIACFGLPFSAFSQQGNGNQPVPESLNVTFQVYLWGDPPHMQREVPLKLGAGGDVPDLEAYKPAQFKFVNGVDATEDITAAKRRISRSYRYNGPNPLVFVQEQPGLDGEIVRTEIAQVNIPTSATRVLLIAFPSGNRTSESYRVIAVPTSEREMPSGTAMVLNIANNEIATRIGSEQILLNGGTAQQIPLKGLQDGTLPVIVGTRDAEGQWQQTYANNLPMADRATAIFVLHGEANNARLEIIRPAPHRGRQANPSL